MADIPGFFFVGAVTLPGFLLYAGEPGLAILALVLLMVAGCLFAIADPEAPFRTVAVRSAPRQRD